MAQPIPACMRDLFQPHTVYRTDDGREALVVFHGPEHAPDSQLRPVHDGHGGVRIGYLAPDGSTRDMLDTEYAFYTGTLTPVRDLPPED